MVQIMSNDSGPDVVSGNRPFKCGKCGKRGLYRDDDPINKVSHIVCPLCGNRWPGGPAPVRIEVKQEEVMGNKKGTCVNCGRPDMSIVGRGLCGTCYGVCVGRTGESLEKALADAKERLWAQYQEANRDANQAQDGSVNKIPPDKIAKIKKAVKNMGEKMKGKLASGPLTEGTEIGNVKSAPTSPPPAPPHGQEITAQETLSEPIVGKIVYCSPVDAQPSCIIIDFGPEDHDLLLYVESLAKKNRRTPDQQILYMIDCNLSADREAGSASGRL